MVPYELNPRILPEFQAKKLKQSLKKFNLVETPAIDTDNKITAGHMRIATLIALGRGDEEIDVRVPNRKLTDQEFKEYNLRSNVNVGIWNYELLKSFDIDLLLKAGFDDSNLTHIFDENLSVEDDEFNVDEAVAKIKTPKTKPGDLIIMGGHRLLCADSTDPAAVAKLIGGHKVSMLNYDPPYNIGLDYTKGVGAKGTYTDKKVNDRKSDEVYRLFLKKALQNGLNHAYPDCHVFCWCDESYVGILQDIYRYLGINNKRVCLWIKNNSNMTPQVAFNKVCEFCIYGTKGTPYLFPSVHNLNEVLNKEVGTGNRLPDDIMDILNIWLVKRDAGQTYDHPTQKPPTLYEKSLRRCSKPGDIILDLFAGSGAIMSAAEQLKRRTFLCELDPIFCDVIIARYKQLTRKENIYVSED